MTASPPISFDSPPSGENAAPRQFAIFRLLVAAASFACVAVAVLSWPSVLASLATADGSIDSELQRIMLSVGSFASLSAGAVLALHARLWRPTIRPRRILFHAVAGVVFTLVLCSLVIGLMILRATRMDPTEYVVPEHELATAVAAARKRGGDEAAWSTTAAWFKERSQPVLIPPNKAWTAPNSERVAALRCVVAGNLGCLVEPPQTVPWRPGQALPFRSPPLPRDVLYQLQRQIFLFELLGPSMTDEAVRTLDFAQAIIEAWRQDNLPWPELRDNSWGDELTANRIQAQMAVMRALRQNGDVPVADEIAFLRSLLQHADRLMDEDQHNFVTNHGMMQNAALLDIAVQYPEFDTDGSWQKTAVERMWHSVDEHVGDDGVFLELAPSYHGTALRILLWFRQQSLAADINVPSAVDIKLQSMVEFLIEILQPDHAFPLIADTSEAFFDPSGWPWETLPDWTQLVTLKRLGTDRSVPPNRPGARYWPDSGYFVLRAPAPTWTRREGMYATLMLGKESHAHKHANKMSLTWFGAGQPLLQGPGYPSFFDMSERIRLIGTSSQNAVTVDGRSQEYGDVETVFVMRKNGPISSNVVGSTNGLVAIQGLSRLYSGVAHRRTLIYGPQVGEFLVIDELDSTTPHIYRQHFRPANDLVVVGSPGELRLVANNDGPALARIHTWAWADGRLTRPQPEIVRGVSAFCVSAKRALLVTRLRIEGATTESDTPEVTEKQVDWRGNFGSLHIKLPVRTPQDLDWRPHHSLNDRTPKEFVTEYQQAGFF